MILEKNNLQQLKSRVDSLMVHPKNGNHLRSHLRATMALDHRRLNRPGKKIRANFLRSTSLLCKILPTNLAACKPTFYTIYTSHVRWNSTMRHCLYHTDQKKNFAIQIALIQYHEGRWKYAWAFSSTVKKFSKPPIQPSGFHFCSASCGESLNEH